MSARWWLLSLGLCLAACEPAGPGLWVKLEDLPSGTEFLSVRGLMDQEHVLDFSRPQQPDSFTFFGLTLPRVVIGRDFAVAVDAHKQDQHCVHASATSGSLLLLEDSHLVITMKMKAQACELRASALGEGSHDPREGSSEISISGNKDRTLLEPRTLIATPAPDAYFAGWRGSCGPTPEQADATGVCLVDDLAPVTALFGLRGCTAAPGLASWCWENPLPQGNDVSGVHGLAHNDVWAVGGAGTMLHFDGNAWSVRRPMGIPLADLLKQDLRAIWGVGRDLFVVGTEGIILHSNDKGVSWTMEVAPDPSKPNLWAVHGTSAVDVWAVGDKVGDKSTVLRRKNGIWSPQELSGTQGSALRGVFVTQERAWIVGEKCLLGRVDRNQGELWMKVGCPFNDSQANDVTLRSVRETSQGVFAVGTASGSGVLLRWDGNRFVVESLPMDMRSPSWSALAELPMEGVLVGGEGGILRRADQGWQAEKEKADATLLALWVSEVGGAFAAGEGGTLYKRYQGNWRRQTIKAVVASATLRAFAQSEETVHPRLVGGVPWVVGSMDGRALVLERSAELKRWRERPLGVSGDALAGAYAKADGSVLLVGANGFSAEVPPQGIATVVTAGLPKPNWKGVWGKPVTCRVGQVDEGIGNRAVAECPPPTKAMFGEEPSLNAIFGSGGVLLAGGRGNGLIGIVYQRKVDGSWGQIANPPGEVQALWMSSGDDLWIAGFDQDNQGSRRARLSRRSGVGNISDIFTYERAGLVTSSSLYGLSGQGGMMAQRKVLSVGGVTIGDRSAALVVIGGDVAPAVSEPSGCQRSLYAVWGGGDEWWAAGDRQALLRRAITK